MKNLPESPLDGGAGGGESSTPPHPNLPHKGGKGYSSLSASGGGGFGWEEGVHIDAIRIDSNPHEGDDLADILHLL
jgi:hypothetical protein